MKAKVVSVDISPRHENVFMAGMGFDRTLARKCHDPLYAKALFLDGGSQRWVLVAADLIAYNKRDYLRILEKVAEAEPALAGVPVSIACSHTHSGPSSYRCYEEHTARQKNIDLAARNIYLDEVVEKIAGAILEAAKDPVEVEAGFGRGHAEVNINRWHITESGEALFIPHHTELEPNGVRDTDVTVFALRESSSGKLLALVYHYTMHAICVCLQSDEVTADFPAYASREIEMDTGGTALFINGAIGDMHPADFDRGHPAAHRAGHVLAKTVKGILNTMNFKADIPLEYAERSIMMQACEPNSHERPSPDWPEKKMTVQAVGIAGRLGLVFVPAEPYVEIGLKLKKLSPFPLTNIVSVTNDFIGDELGNKTHTAYMALEESYTEYRYEPTYTRPDFSFDSTERMLSTSLELLKTIKD